MRRRARGALKQAFKIIKHKTDCYYCKKYGKWEDVPEDDRRDWNDVTYDPRTGARTYGLLKRCPRCRGKKWYWRTTKELIYQCFGGPLDGAFATMAEAGEQYAQYNRGIRAGDQFAKAILLHEGACREVPE